MKQQPSEEQDASQPGCHQLWINTTCAIVVVAIAIRLILNFRHTLAPGMDAAFYPMQTRWLIKYGELMFSDMPLMFWLNVGVSTLLELGGWSFDAATQLSPRLIDCFSQPWAAVPIMVLGYAWTNGRRELLPYIAAAAVIAVISPPIMRMAGDFQKNSLGLVWMAFSILALHEALASDLKIWRWLIVALFVVLAALTHVGAFAITCVILAGCLLGFLIANGSKFWQQHSRKILVVAAVCIVGLVGLVLVMSQVAPAKTQRFLNLTRIASKFNLNVRPLALIVAGAVYALLGFLLWKIWKHRPKIEPANFAIGFGMIFGLTIMSLPVLEETWLMRFQLMTPIPAAILTMLLLKIFQIDQRSVWIKRSVLAVAGLLAIAAVFFPQGPVISEAAAKELKSAHFEFIKTGAGWSKGKIKNTLIVAPHGIEFWAGLLLGTRASQNIPNRIDEYERVLVLKANDGFRGHGPMRPGLDSSTPPALPRDDRPANSKRGRHSVEEIEIPDDVEIFYQGKLFSLHELKQ